MPVDTHATATLNNELQVMELAMLVKKLSLALRKASPEATLPSRALDYLQRNNLMGSPLR